MITENATHHIDRTPIVVRRGTVYANGSGEERLVVSVGFLRANPVVEWRTVDPKLPHGAKAQGSATVSSFRRWAITSRPATEGDFSAFEEVQRRRRYMREENRWVRDTKKRRKAQS